MTYKELLNLLSKLSDEQLMDTVTIYDDFEDEYFGVTEFGISEEDDVLHDNHFFLTIKTPTAR